MKYTVIFRKKAEAHLIEAYTWYQKQKPGLGDEFLLSVEATLSEVNRSPLLFPIRHMNIRCSIVSRFPYGVFYFINDKNIIVIAVFHFKRNPKHLKK